jgi:glutathione S-transferase
LNRAWVYAFMSPVRQSSAPADRSLLKASVLSWGRQMAILEAQLSKTGSDVVGSEFTPADVVVGLSVHRWFVTPMERPSLGRASAYYERLSGRPTFMLHGRNGIP